MFSLNKILVASSNTGKVKEFEQILGLAGLDVISQASLQVPSAPEPYGTFVENALSKARNAGKYTDFPVISDDSGICVKNLDGRPGVRSARYAHSKASDEENNSFLLEKMSGESDREAYFYCVIVILAKPTDPAPLIAFGKWSGEILKAPRGKGGFGYDSIFFDPKLGKSAAELSSSEKNTVSHRGCAMKNLLKLINSE